jgi:NAD-dependent SIR2 family protein deacetylase
MAGAATPAEIEALVKFIDSSRNLVVLTGAGVSTSSTQRA